MDIANSDWLDDLQRLNNCCSFCFDFILYEKILIPVTFTILFYGYPVNRDLNKRCLWQSRV